MITAVHRYCLSGSDVFLASKVMLGFLKITLAIVLVIFTFGCQTLPAPMSANPSISTPERDWPVFRGSLNRDGYNPFESELEPPLELRWSRKLVGNIYSSPAVLDGVVYVGCYSGLYALDAATGDKKWNSETSATVYSSPAIAEGVVYIGAHNGRLYALDAANGAEMWTFQTKWPIYSSPAVAGGIVYFGSDDEKVYALDVRTGKPVWGCVNCPSSSNTPFSSPLISPNQRIYSAFI